MQVKIKENRQVSVYGIGQIIGENNATVLNFSFPEKIVGIDINELNKYIVFDIEGIKPQRIINNQFSLSNLYTQKSELVMQVLIKKGKSLLFESEKFLLEFQDNIEVHYETTIDDLDVIDNLITQYEEKVKEVKKIKDDLIDFENTIQEAEELRDDFEVIRNLNEENRILNENKRIQEFDNILNKLQKSINSVDKIINEKVVKRFNSMEFCINKNGFLEVKILNE